MTSPNPLSIRRMAAAITRANAARNIPLVGPHQLWVLRERPDGAQLGLGAFGTLYEVQGEALSEWDPANTAFEHGLVASVLRRLAPGPGLRQRSR